MKKVAIIIIVLGVGIAGARFFLSEKASNVGQNVATENKDGSDTSTVPINIISQPQGKRDAQAIPGGIGNGNPVFTDEEGIENIRPAAAMYTSAQQAFDAVLKGAKDFDDSILEQFTEPGSDCSWCPQFYSLVHENLTNPATPQDQKSYLAEVLAISGRTDNIQVLVDSIKNAPSSNDADIYAEALELALGDDSITRVLGEQLVTTNDTLREASVAAITNQGSLLAAELLQKHIEQKNDPDAYYSVGIGPGEFIPDASALPFVQEQVAKRDQFSPMWAKALINTGVDGVRMVFEQLEISNSPDADRALIKDAIDHVNFEDGIQELTNNVIATSKNPVAVDFAKQIQNEFAQADVEDENGITVP